MECMIYASFHQSQMGTRIGFAGSQRLHRLILETTPRFTSRQSTHLV